MKLRDLIGRNNFFIARVRVYRSVLVMIFSAVSLYAANPSAPAVKTLDEKTQKQIVSIADVSTQICLPAIEALGRSKNPAVVKPLADALDSEERPIVRRYLVDALGQLRMPAALEALQNALTDADVQVRQSAVAALGLLGTAEAQATLVDAVTDEKNAAVKPHLIAQLEATKTPEAKAALKKYKNDTNPAIRKMATDALGRMPMETK